MSFLGTLWKHKWIVLTCVVVLFGTTSYLVYDQVGGVSEEEKIAVTFYKALLVDADCQKAMNYIAPKFRNSPYVIGKLSGECEISKETPLPRSPVLVLENPEDKNPEYEKIFYIYEPKTQETYLVSLQNTDGKWQVVVGLISTQVSYETLNSQYSGLQNKWKEIPLP